jgi:ferric-dicitrate binding protein FerR (iron transport regulator)
MARLGHARRQPLRVIVGGTVMNAHASRFAVRIRDSRNMDLLVSNGQVLIGTTLVNDGIQLVGTGRKGSG